MFIGCHSLQEGNMFFNEDTSSNYNFVSNLRRRSEGNPWVVSSREDRRRNRPRTSPPLSDAPSENPRRRRVRPRVQPSSTTTSRPVVFPTRTNRRTPGTRRRRVTVVYNAPTTPATVPTTTRRRTTTTLVTSTTSIPRRRATVVYRREGTSTEPPTRHTTPLTREVAEPRVTTTLRPRGAPRYPAKPTFNPRKVTAVTEATSSTTEIPSSSTTESNEVVPGNFSTTTPFSDACLDCICYGASGCNFDIKYSCYGEDECGPYKIDYAYWYDAGYPGYKGYSDDFHSCAKDKTCAEKTVRQYITRYVMDCNQDGFIDCMDYAAIHKGGPEYCNSYWVYESKFWNSFTECSGFEEKAAMTRFK